MSAALVVVVIALAGALLRDAIRESPGGQIRGAAKHDRMAHPARWAPSPEQRELIRAAEHATPDHLGRDLVSVLASLPEGKQRELVFYDTPDPYHQWLTARAWALRSETVHGDPREIKLFLDILDEPISPEPSEYLGALSSSRAASYERLVALLALTRAAFAGEPHRPRFLDFEKAALRHLGYSSYRDSAITLLAALDEHNALTQNAKMKFEQWIARPPYSIVLDKWIMTDKEYFYAQGPLNSPPTSSP